MAAAMVAFAAAAVTIALLMFILSAAVAGVRDRFVGTLEEGTAVIKRWGGWLLLAVGLWLFSLGLFSGFFSRFFTV